MIYQAELYGLWIAATVTQPGDNIILNSPPISRAVQSSDYDLHAPKANCRLGSRPISRWDTKWCECMPLHPALRCPCSCGSLADCAPCWHPGALVPTAQGSLGGDRVMHGVIQMYGSPKKCCKPLHIEENIGECWSTNVMVTTIAHVLLGMVILCKSESLNIHKHMKHNHQPHACTTFPQKFSKNFP